MSLLEVEAKCYMQALSPVGRCKTFDASGDGYGRGEGCTVVVLMQSAAKSLSAMAILKITAINQDGRSSGLTAPNGPAQRALISNAMKSSGVWLCFLLLETP